MLPHVLLALMLVENLTARQGALNSTLSNTVGMNWNGDCELGLLIQHQCLTIVLDE